ncbi:MAG: SH3 domain-containing protein [Lachnospiraceae bacterium]
METCFISNAEDCNWYFANKDAIAAAVVDGIVDGFGLEKEQQISIFKPYMLKVIDTALNIRKGPGTNYPIVGRITDNGSYTVVAEADGPGSKKWGRLLSGAGWIALDSDLVQR